MYKHQKFRCTSNVCQIFIKGFSDLCWNVWIAHSYTQLRNPSKASYKMSAKKYSTDDAILQNLRHNINFLNYIPSSIYLVINKLYPMHSIYSISYWNYFFFIYNGFCTKQSMMHFCILAGTFGLASYHLCDEGTYPNAMLSVGCHCITEPPNPNQPYHPFRSSMPDSKLEGFS